jgi:hypothetical protein
VFLPLSPVTLYVFACGIGLLWLGTVPLTNGLVGQIFGMRYAAMLASIVFFGHQIGSFFGVFFTDAFMGQDNPRNAVMLIEPSREGAVALMRFNF